APSVAPPHLSELATQILLLAEAGQRKVVFVTKTMQGFSLSAGDREIVGNTMDDRKEIEHRAAVKELVEGGYIEDRTGKGQMLWLTKAGLDAAEELTKATQPPEAYGTQITDESDILVLLQSWVSKQRWGTRSPTISFADLDRELNLARGSAAKMLE